MVVSFILLFLAGAWILYVYLDRYKYFNLPGAPAKESPVAKAGAGSSPKAKPVSKDKPLLGASKPYRAAAATAPVVTADTEGAGASEESQTDPEYQEEKYQEDGPGDDTDQEEQPGSGESDAENDYPGDYGDEDNSDTPDPEDQEEDFMNTGGEPQEDEREEGGYADDQEPDDEETSQYEYPEVVLDSDIVVLGNKGRPYYESARASSGGSSSPSSGLQAPLSNQVQNFTMKTTEREADQEALEQVGDYEDAFTTYSLDEVMDEIENRPLKEAAHLTPHYEYRDLPLSEYASQFRTLRQGALLIRKELERWGVAHIRTKCSTELILQVKQLNLN